MRGAVEIAIETAAYTSAQLAAIKGMDILGVRAFSQSIKAGKAAAKEMATQTVGTAVAVADDVLKNAELVEGALDNVPKIVKYIRKPARKIVKDGFELMDDIVGNTPATGALSGVTTASGAREVLSSATDDVVEKGTKVLSSTHSSTGASIVKHGASALQAAFVLSDIARAKTYTDTTIAYLKPLAAIGGSAAGGMMTFGLAAPAAGIAAPIALEVALKKCEGTIEPLLKSTAETLKKIPGVGLTHNGAVAIGSGINSSASYVASSAWSLMTSTASLVSSTTSSALSMISPSSDAVPEKEEIESSAVPSVAPKKIPNVELNLGDIITKIIAKKIAGKLPEAPEVDELDGLDVE